MAEDTSIQWTHHTFSPWRGCTNISPACDHCYAEALAKRVGWDVWGPHKDRALQKTWNFPRKWNRELEGTGERKRIFVASIADVGDNHKSIQPEWRRDLVALVRECTNLDFQFLTKRPQNIAKLYPDLMESWPSNVWMGATVENREEMERRGPALAKLPAVVKFWSCEPLLSDLGDIPADILPSWVITGGESGPGYRPVDPDWFRNLRDQCLSNGVAFLFKQWEGTTQAQIKAKGRELDGVVHNGYPQPVLNGPV